MNNNKSPRITPPGIFVYSQLMQLVTPSEVAIAVRIAASVWMMNFQVSFLIFLTIKRLND